MQLALVRFGLAERTNFCTHLTEQLLVARLQDDQRILVSLRLGLNLNLRRQLNEDAVSETQRQLNEVSLVAYTETDTYKLQSLLVTLAYANNHVVNQ